MARYIVKFQRSGYKKRFLFKLFRKHAKPRVLIKLLSLVFGLLLFAGLNAAKTFADGFYPSADVYSCLFRQTYALSIGALPRTDMLDGLVEYDPQHIVGSVDPDFASKHTFTDFAFLATPRKLGVADRVSVPPNSDVDISFYYYNDAGHTVTPSLSYLFVSKPGANSDLTRLGATGQYVGVGFNISGNWINRTGKAIVIGNTGAWAPVNPSAPPKGIKVASFETIQPMKISNQVLSHSYENGDLVVKYLTEVMNTSTYHLSNIRFEHMGFEATRNYYAGERFLYSYNINFGSDYPLEVRSERPVISDPNSHTECAGKSGGAGINYDPHARVILSQRSDSTAPAGWSAYQVDYQSNGSIDHFCVTLIPYWVNGIEQTFSLAPELDLDKSLSDDDESGVLAVSSHLGEEVRISLSLTNSGARAENLIISESFDHERLEVIDICGGQIDNVNFITWRFDKFAHGETWDCLVKLKVREGQVVGDYAEQSQTTLCDSTICYETINGEIRYKVEEPITPDQPLPESTPHEPESPPEVVLGAQVGIARDQVISSTKSLANSGSKLIISYTLVSLTVIIAVMIRFCYYKATKSSGQKKIRLSIKSCQNK